MRQFIAQKIVTDWLWGMPWVAKSLLALRRHYDPITDRAAYVAQVFRQHARASLAATGRRSMDGWKVLEIGPGGNVAVSGLMLLTGAHHAFCLDIIPWNKADNEAVLAAAITALMQSDDAALVSERYHARASADPAELAAELLQHVKYLCPASIATCDLPDSAIDYIFSQAVFEHIHDPAKGWQHIARLLRPGGVTTHQIDLRDHRNPDRPHDHLRFSDHVWRMANNHSPFAVRNRWRLSDYREALTANKLRMARMEKTRTQRVADDVRLHPTFKSRDSEDLEAIDIFIVAIKDSERSST
jgi:SAM-dependent methyltransferase